MVPSRRIGCSDDHVFGHEFFCRPGHKFLESPVICADAAVVDAGAEEIDIVRYMGFYLFVQQIGIGDDTDQFLVIVDDGNGRHLILHKQIDQFKDRRIRTGCHKGFFHDF